MSLDDDLFENDTDGCGCGCGCMLMLLMFAVVGGLAIRLFGWTSGLY